MIRWGLIAIGVFASALLMAEPKPDNLRLSTWVREDLFAGLLANDMERFEAGVKKLDAFQAERPDAQGAMAWRGFVHMVRAIKAYEAGRRDEFDRLYKTSVETFEGASTNEATFAISGGTWSYMGDRVPPELRTEVYRRAYESYTKLKAAQSAFFDKLPLHMRGEVLAGLAQASERLGNAEESQSWIKQILETLPGTPYETRARKWQENPTLAKSTVLTCLTCHDPGRLQNMSQASK